MSGLNIIIACLIVLISVGLTFSFTKLCSDIAKEKTFIDENSLPLFHGFADGSVSQAAIIALVIIVTATVVLTNIWLGMSITEILLIAILLSVLWICSYTDIRYRLIPNSVLIYAAGIRIVIFLFQVISGPDMAGIIAADTSLAAAMMLIASMMCRIISRNSIGMGDVKLLSLMGLYLGILSCFSAVFAMLFVIFTVSLVLLLTKKATRETTIPLAPFALIGTVLAATLFSI